MLELGGGFDRDETRGLSGDGAVRAPGGDLGGAAVGVVAAAAAADAGALDAVESAAGLAVEGFDARDAVAAGRA